MARRGHAADRAAFSPPSALTETFEQSCLSCHEGEGSEGGLDLTELSADLRNPVTTQKWVRILDRVRDGEMPPPDDEELSPANREQFVGLGSRWIIDFQRRQFAAWGRVRGRRLTNLQLERTLQDLLAIDIPLASLMPTEPRNDGFTGIASNQAMSHFQLQYHLEVVDAALDEAFSSLFRENPKKLTLPAKELARPNPKKRNRQPELINGLSVAWSAGALAFYGQMPKTKASNDGWYRIEVTASAVNKPNEHGVWCSVRSGACVASNPTLHWVGTFEATNEPKQHTFDAWIEGGHMLEIRPSDATIKKAYFKNGQAGTGEGGPQKVPGVALHSISIQRITPRGGSRETKKRLFGDLPVAFDKASGRVKLRSYNPMEDATKQLKSFIRQALRRKLSEKEMEPFVEILRNAIAAKMDPIDALRATYRAVLCSPRFIYFVEPANPKSSSPGKLDQDAIASRLSYLLTGSGPDETLRQLADEGQLSDRYVLNEQVDRLLEGKNTLRFVKDFTAEWLDLVDINFTEPDRRLYREFDPIVQNSMLEETHLFLDELIRNDSPVRELLGANFTYLNGRLAKYYRVKNVSGTAMRKVKLPGDSVRGGLLSHGSILKVTANGTNTSPVLRGVWISERILGTEIPPPPENVPAVEPDIRGATTIRQQLEKHVSDAQCASCHRSIDPPGYALENFDPAGQWRDRYFYKKAKGKNKRPLIDAGFVLADGREFSDFKEFRNLICRDDDALARNFAEKLLVYGTGAKIQFIDRKVVDNIVKETRGRGHGLKTLIKATVNSPTFLRK